MPTMVIAVEFRFGPGSAEFARLTFGPYWCDQITEIHHPPCRSCAIDDCPTVSEPSDSQDDHPARLHPSREVWVTGSCIDSLHLTHVT